MRASVVKILVIGPAWVGDMIMAQVLFKCLVAEYSHLELTVVAPKSTVALAQRMPEVSRVLALDVAHKQLGLGVRYRFAKRLRFEAFDQAIVLPNSWKSALVPFWARIKVRTGWLGESRYGLLNDHRRLDKAAYPLMIQRFAALAFPVDSGLSDLDRSNLGLPDSLPFPVLSVDSDAQFQALERLGLQSGRPIMVVCPGAEFGPAKRWPVEYFAQVSEWYLERGGQVWVLGSPKESKDADALRLAVAESARGQLFNLAGKTSLLEAVDLMALASVVISNDSGLMHVAAALGRPVVALFGSTSPDFTPPLGPENTIKIVATNEPCRPCFQRTCPLGHLNCLTRLMPDQVVSAVNQLGA